VQVARLVEDAQAACSAAEAARSTLHADLKAAELGCNAASQKLLRSTESNHALRKELAAVTREAELERSMAQETIEELEDELDALQRELDACKGRGERTSASGGLLWQHSKVRH
jgi:septal ring factor EnvC (AmiA/AmiB activator)